jgi:non-specific serine/threonine protein kinase/serine/threonine-protein kinase
MMENMNEQSIFTAALEQDPSARQAFLDEACGDNLALRQRLERLIAAHEAAASFMDQPAVHSPTINYPQIERIGALIGPYKLVEQIGEGGMGTVFMAQQSEPVKRVVAVKIVKPGMDSKAVLARFEAERQALALMDHPNIARVLDAGATQSSRPYFVMELVKGVPITQYCDQHKLAPRERLELFLPVCQAIQHAHQKGVTHRDIKPSNVLIALYDDRPVPKVIDFGLAKAAGQALTDATLVTGFGALVGTPEYMSPEQANVNNLDIDTRSDVYSLGVLLYELLTGTTPMDRKSLGKAALLEVLRIVREVEAPRPSIKLSSSGALPGIAAQRRMEPAKLSRLVRGDLDWITMKCLEKDRTRRYETANGLARDVQRYLSDEPVEACPPSATYRLRKFAKKNRAALTTAAIITFLLVAGIAVSAWQAVRATRAERDADEKRQLAEKSAAAEKAAKEQTQKRLAQIEKGVELFAGMLSGINPRSESKGGEPLYVQLRKRAEKAADALDAEAVGDPLAMARLQTTLGITLRDLGNGAKAVEVLEKAHAIRERELGTDDHETLVTLEVLAMAYQESGKLREAIALHEQARDRLVKKHGANDPNTLNTLNNLASAYRAVGRSPEAIALFEQVRNVEVKKLGAGHLNTLSTLNNLALAYQAAGRLPEAIALFEQVRDARVKKLGADHVSTLNTLNNLALAFQAAGKLPKAIAILEQVRDTRVKKLGADHPDALVSLNNLATAYKAAGRLPEAIALLEQVRNTQIKELGADRPETLIALASLATAYQAAGRMSEAIPLFEQAATGIAKQRFQQERAGLIVGDTIIAYVRAGKFDKAEGWCRQWLPVLKRSADVDTPAYPNVLSILGLSCLKQKKWADAEPVLRESLAIREKKTPDNWGMFSTQSMLGGALLGQKKYADAEPLLLKGYEGMKQREETIPKDGKVRFTEAIDRLIEFYAATNKPDDAKKWRAERAKYPVVAEDKK